MTFKAAKESAKAPDPVCREGVTLPVHGRGFQEEDSSPGYPQRRLERETSPERPRKRLEREHVHDRNPSTTNDSQARKGPPKVMMRQRSFRSQSQETFRRDKKGQRARRRERHNAQSTTQGSEALFTQQQMRRADRESKKGKEQALAMAKLKMKSWVEILKVTWTAWTPVAHNFTKLKGAIESKRLPQLNEEETEMLMQTIRTTAVSTPWCLDLDMLMGLILVLGAETFEAIWKEFALELNAWLRGEEIRQMTRKIELRERLELQGPLLEEVTKWKERKERRERKEGVAPLILPNSTLSPPSPIL